MDIGFKQSVTYGFTQETFIEQSSMVGILEGGCKDKLLVFTELQLCERDNKYKRHDMVMCHGRIWVEPHGSTTAIMKITGDFLPNFSNLASVPFFFNNK